MMRRAKQFVAGLGPQSDSLTVLPPAPLRRGQDGRDDVDAKVRRAVRLSLAAVIVVLAAYAWSQRWVQDDAYITFRYSDHLASGLGPVWNPEQPVEGYTNFLWMVLTALGMLVEVAPQQASAVLGIACFCGSLVIVYHLARRVIGDNRWALMAAVLSGTNYSFLMYATGGLETQLDAMLTLWLLFLTVRALQDGEASVRNAALTSVLVSLALMTRPDSVLVGALAIGVQAYVIRRHERRRFRACIALLLPALALTASWLTWKYSYYGNILPNTYYAKLGGHRAETLVRGIVYVAWLFVSYWWIVAVAAVVAMARKNGVGPRDLVRLDPAVGLLAAHVVLWLSYIVWTGGDIMEFRLLVPVIPVVLVLLLVLAHRAVPDIRMAVALGAILIVGSVTHALTFQMYVRPPGISTIPILRQVGGGQPQTNWESIGRALRQDLGSPPDVTIAVSPAGAIPFFSKLRTIDMLGLNDAWVARHGYARQGCVVCAGHSRMAQIAYLNAQGVNLLIGDPQIVRLAAPPRGFTDVVRRMYFDEKVDYEAIAPDARLVFIPLGGDFALAVAYLSPSPSVDSLLRRGTWLAGPVRQPVR